MLIFWSLDMKRGRRPGMTIVQLQKQVIMYHGRHMLDVCLSESRALALSQHDCREGPTVKVPVIIPNRAMLLFMKGKMTASHLRRAKKGNLLGWIALWCLSAL